MAKIIYPIPSFTTGYAISKGKSLFPNLWEGWIVGWDTSLGFQGTTRLFDLSGRGNLGTATSVEIGNWISSSTGPAIVFDQTNYFSDNLLNPSITGDFTLHTKASSTAGVCRVIDLAQSGSQGVNMVLNNTAGKAALADDGGVGSSLSSTGAGNNGVFHNLTVTRRGTTYSFYFDDEPVQSTVGTLITYTRLFFGGWAITPANFSGTAIRAYVWNRCLSGAEVRSIHQGSLPTYCKPRSIFTLLGSPAATYTATSALMISGMTLSGSVEFSPGTKTATSALNITNATLSSSAEFDAPIYTSSAPLIISNVTISSSATFDDFYVSTASLSISNIILSASSTFSPGTKTATSALVISNVTISVSTQYFSPPFIVLSSVTGHSDGSSGDPKSSLTWSHTIAAGTERYLLVSIGIKESDGSPNINTITYNNTNLILLNTENLSVNKVELWGLIEPVIGTHDIVVTLNSAADFISGHSVGFTGVNQTYSVESLAENTGSNSIMSIDVTTVADNTWPIASVMTASNTLYTSDQTNIRQYSGLQGYHGLSHDGPLSPAGLTTLSWQSSNGASWAAVALALRPSTASDLYTATSSLIISNVILSAVAEFTSNSVGTAALIISNITLSASSTFSPGTKTATAALVISNATLSSSAEFDVPVYSATSSLTITNVILSGSAEFDVPVYSATSSLIINNVVLSGSAEFDVPVYSATSSLIVNNVILSGSSTFSPGTKTATASLVISNVTLSSSVTFSPGTKTATASLLINNVTLSASSTFSPGTKTATATLVISNVTLSGSVEFDVPIYSATSSLIISNVTLSGSVEFDVPAYSATSSLIISNMILSGSAEFSPGAKTATVALVITNAILSASSTFSPGTKTASAILIISNIVLSGSAEFDIPLYSATAALVISNITLSASAQFTAEIYEATAALIISNITLSASSEFSPGTKTATSSLIVSNVTLSGSSTFSPGTKTATAAFIVSNVTLSASSTFSPGIKTATASLLINKVTLLGSAEFDSPIYTSTSALSLKSLLLSGIAETVFDDLLTNVPIMMHF